MKHLKPLKSSKPSPKFHKPRVVTNYPVDIDGVVVYYAKKKLDVEFFKNTKKYKDACKEGWSFKANKKPIK